MDEPKQETEAEKKSEDVKKIKLPIPKISVSGVGGLLKKYWPVIAILLIMVLAFYVRLLDYRWPYLRNIDSYNFARQIAEVAQYGHLLPYDELGLAPDILPRVLGQDLYIYLGGYMYLFFKLFVSDLTMFQFLIWLPAILAAAMVIPMYFIGRTLYDRRAGVLAAFFIVFDIAVVSRTLGGDPDSDGSVLLMPLISIAAFLVAYKYANAVKKIDKKYAIYTLISGIALGLWGYTWSGYWFVIWLLTGFVALKLIADIIKTRDLMKGAIESKHTLIVFASTLVIFFIMVIPIFGLQSISNTILGPIQFGDIKSEENSQFPNVYVSVAELQKPNGNNIGEVTRDIIQRTSPINFGENPFLMLVTPFFLMIYGLVYLAFSYYKKRQHFDTLVLLLIWFIGPFIATIIAVRFSILFSAPIAVGSAIFLSKLIRLVRYKESFGD